MEAPTQFPMLEVPWYKLDRGLRARLRSAHFPAYDLALKRV